MSDGLKLYLVSILGVREGQEDGRLKALFCHIPFIIEARDIDGASDEACIEADKWFPADQGFVDCNITVKPLPSHYYERLMTFANLKRLAEKPDTKEEMIYFRYNITHEIEEDEGVLTAYDRPVS